VLSTRPMKKSANPRPVWARLFASRVKSPEKLNVPRGAGGCKMLKFTCALNSAPNFMMWRPLITLTVSMKCQTFSNSAVGWKVALPKLETPSTLKRGSPPLPGPNGMPGRPTCADRFSLALNWNRSLRRRV